MKSRLFQITGTDAPAKLNALIFCFIFQNFVGISQCCNLEVHVRETFVNGETELNNLVKSFPVV